jgi:hypothetical protein
LENDLSVSATQRIRRPGADSIPGIFVGQCIVFWTGGIKLWLVLHDEQGLDAASANAVVLLVGFLAVALFAELFYRLVDQPSRWAAKQTYLWLID